MIGILIVGVPAVLGFVLFEVWGALRLAPHDPAVARQRVRRLVRGQAVAAMIVYTAMLMWTITTAAAEEAAQGQAGGPAAAVSGGLSTGDGIALLGSALATGLAVLGAGYAVGTVGSAALGVVAEKPEMLGRTLVFIGLAEGLAIYGLVISILLLQQLR